MISLTRLYILWARAVSLRASGRVVQALALTNGSPHATMEPAVLRQEAVVALHQQQMYSVDGSGSLIREIILI